MIGVKRWRYGQHVSNSAFFVRAVYHVLTSNSRFTYGHIPVYVTLSNAWICISQKSCTSTLDQMKIYVSITHKLCKMDKLYRSQRTHAYVKILMGHWNKKISMEHWGITYNASVTQIIRKIYAVVVLQADSNLVTGLYNVRYNLWTITLSR